MCFFGHEIRATDSLECWEHYFQYFQNIEQVIALTTQVAQPTEINWLCPAVENS
jgi:hypothetical protein